MKRIAGIICCIIAICGTAFGQAPSANALVKAWQNCTSSNPKPVTDLLDATGYEYRFSTTEPDYLGYGTYSTYVYSKNCKVVHEEYSNGLEYSPSKEAANASIVIIRAQGNEIKGIEVQIYSKAGFTTWASQLKAMGYKLSPDSGRGNRGQSWEYGALGKPAVSIWNDYDTTYVLSISM